MVEGLPGSIILKSRTVDAICVLYSWLVMADPISDVGKISTQPHIS